jgi:hypothetical protein
VYSRLCTARSQSPEVMLPVSLRAVCKGRGLTADVLGGGYPAKGGLCRTQDAGGGGRAYRDNTACGASQSNSNGVY